MYKVNLGSTLNVAFTPQQYIDDVWQNITPDSYQAYLENSQLEKVFDLPISELDGKYYVSVDTNNGNLQQMEIYYITFKWEKDENTIVQRVKIFLVPEGGVI
ncbi:MAG: hypothetical protein J7L43_00255 [Candidatus Aenigmarchaeota archaeon]|nr:hypothetical protein [Candidatus Aenigmarchaeota archaeon]